MKVKGSMKLYVAIAVAIGLLTITLKMTLQTGTMTTTNPAPASSGQLSPTASTDLKPTLRWYDPAAIRVGDRVASWKVTEKQQETYGKGSVAYTLEGEASISGTYMVNYEEATYNSNQIVFIADEDSSLGLPQPLAFKGSSNRMILHLSNSEEHNKLGISGSTGRVTIVINKYFSVYADILEGVSDAAEVIQIKKSETIPPPATEIAQADFDKALEPFPLSPLQLDANIATDAASLQHLQEWLMQVNKQYTKSLGSFSLKRISPAQKDQLQQWLMQAFTETKAMEILAEHVPQSGIHYLLSSILLGLRPYSEVKEIKNQELNVEDSETLTYKVLNILSGTNDAQLTYVMKRVDGKWKIHQYTIKLI